MNQCHRKVVNGRRVADAIKFLVNAKSLQLECIRVLHKTLVMPVIMYGRDNDMEEERGLGLGLYRWTTLEEC